jgi:UDP-N-acetylmuramoyl-tripeptide--D-alanyl-D-alanine ligase
MKSLDIEAVRRAVKGRWKAPGAPADVEGVSTDSRHIHPGDLFVALKGPTFDGHAFLTVAAAGGAIAAIVHQKADIPEAVAARFGAGLIGVDDTTIALGMLATHYRGRLAATVVAVTGSNGKTTVKAMIHHILAQRLAGYASPKSFNNNIGVPLTLLAVGAEHDYVICEVGTNAPGEIAALARIVRPDVAVITSVGPTHLEKLIDVEHVAAEKAALLGALPADGLAIVNGDSLPLAQALKPYPVRTIRFGTGQDADLRLTAYEAVAGGGRFQLNGRAWFDLKVPGRHNAMNALSAIAVAQRFGFSQDEAGAALADFTGPEMRLQTIRAGTVTIVNDAFNANPASLEAAGDSLASFPAPRRILVVGDMLELGERALELHRASGTALARCGANMIVGVGKLGGEIAAAAEAAGCVACPRFATVEQACKSLPGLLTDGDVVLIKGSHGMAMERLVPAITAAFAGKPPAQGKATTCCRSV